MSSFAFDWNELAFGSKKPVNELNATFIAAPRELSQARLKQLVREWLPRGNILLGLAKEPYVLDLEDCPQFKMLAQKDVQPVADAVARSGSTCKVYTLAYFQRDLPFLLDKLSLAQTVFVRGSWYRAFHLRPEFYALVRRKLSYQLVSPFASEAEAKNYASAFTQQLVSPESGRIYSVSDMFALANKVAKRSFAYSEYQTGIALGRRKGSGYQLVTTTHNRIIPYETYAMHFGASREENFSVANDLNHYDVNHAEVELITKAGREGIDLKGTTLFINLLPCPTCARMFASTEIGEFIYREDHSSGYAIKMLELAGKKVRRIVK